MCSYTTGIIGRRADFPKAEAGGAAQRRFGCSKLLPGESRVPGVIILMAWPYLTDFGGEINRLLTEELDLPRDVSR